VILIFNSKTGKNGQILRGEQRWATAEFRKTQEDKICKAMLEYDSFENVEKTESEIRSFREADRKAIKSSSSHQKKRTDTVITRWSC